VVAGMGLGQLVADTLNIPYSNVSTGDTITAVKWNSNFQSIEAIVNGLINDANIENDGITGSLKLAAGTVTLAKLDSDSVNSAKIVDASIVNADILDATIAEAKLDINSAPADQNLVYWNNGAGKLDYVDADCTGLITFGADNPADAFGYAFYSPPWGEGAASESTVNNFIVPSSITLTGISVGGSTAPGVGDTRVFTVRDDASDTAVTCTITGTVDNCSASGFAVAVAAGSIVTIGHTPAGTPAGASSFAGSVCFTDRN